MADKDGKVIRSETFPCEKRELLLYSSLDGYDAHLLLTLYYYVDSHSGRPVILKTSLDGYSFSDLEVSFEEFSSPAPYGNYIQYVPALDKFKAYYAGTLHFKDAIGNEHKEGVSLNTYIER